MKLFAEAYLSYLFFFQHENKFWHTAMVYFVVLILPHIFAWFILGTIIQAGLFSVCWILLTPVLLYATRRIAFPHCYYLHKSIREDRNFVSWADYYRKNG